jgi:precorrin isomerase
MKLTKPFFIRALKACATVVVDLNIVEKAIREKHPPWIGDNIENFITRMMTVSKEAEIARLKTKREQTIEE